MLNFYETQLILLKWADHIHRAKIHIFYKRWSYKNVQILLFIYLVKEENTHFYNIFICTYLYKNFKRQLFKTGEWNYITKLAKGIHMCSITISASQSYYIRLEKICDSSICKNVHIKPLWWYQLNYVSNHLRPSHKYEPNFG